MDDTSPAPRGRHRSVSSHQAILRAANDLIREDGYRNLTIEAIAVRAGVGKQTIYRWWPSKGAVAIDALIDQLDVNATWQDTGDFRADMADHIARFIAFLENPAYGPHVAALTAEALFDPAVAAIMFERISSPSRSAHRASMARAQAAGIVRDDIDPDLAIDLMYAPLWFRFLVRSVPLNEVDPEALRDAVMRAIEPRPVHGAGE